MDTFRYKNKQNVNLSTTLSFTQLFNYIARIQPLHAPIHDFFFEELSSIDLTAVHSLLYAWQQGIPYTLYTLLTALALKIFAQS